MDSIPVVCVDLPTVSKRGVAKSKLYRALIIVAIKQIRRNHPYRVYGVGRKEDSVRVRDRGTQVMVGGSTCKHRVRSS